jgi:hypothetical protein
VVLNCANVTTAEIAAPKLINRKRQGKAKPPLFSYRVLQISALQTACTECLSISVRCRHNTALFWLA